MRSPDDLRSEFLRFAGEECRGSSPLYERLSRAVAEDPEMLALASRPREGQRAPNLFFAAVHFLLLKGVAHPLVRFYESLSGAFDGTEDPYPSFRSFCLEHGGEVAKLVSSRLVQTNEVRRCACLLPAFVLVARMSPGRPLYLIEIGAAAGLLLLWDHYGYRYGDTLECGDRDSPVQLVCGLRGEGSPAIPDVLPPVASRLGIDLNPIDARAPDAGLWLRALIWPEHRERARLLARAIEVAQRDPPPLIGGDAVEILPKILSLVPPECALCVFRAWTWIPQNARERMSSLLAEYGAERDLFVISTAGQRGNEMDLRLTSFVKGVKTVELIARCETHGGWLEWLRS